MTVSNHAFGVIYDFTCLLLSSIKVEKSGKYLKDHNNRIHNARGIPLNILIATHVFICFRSGIELQ